MSQKQIYQWKGNLFSSYKPRSKELPQKTFFILYCQVLKQKLFYQNCIYLSTLRDIIFSQIYLLRILGKNQSYFFGEWFRTLKPQFGLIIVYTRSVVKKSIWKKNTGFFLFFFLLNPRIVFAGISKTTFLVICFQKHLLYIQKISTTILEIHFFKYYWQFLSKLFDFM